MRFGLYSLYRDQYEFYDATWRWGDCFVTRYSKGAMRAIIRSFFACILYRLKRY